MTPQEQADFVTARNDEPRTNAAITGIEALPDTAEMQPVSDARLDAFATEMKPAPRDDSPEGRLSRVERVLTEMLIHMAASSASPVAPDDARRMLHFIDGE